MVAPPPLFSSAPAGHAWSVAAALDGRVLDIWFDGFPALFRHHFIGSELICDTAPSNGAGFRSPYLSAALTDGLTVLHFSKNNAASPGPVILILDFERGRALSLEFPVGGAGRQRSPSVRLLRGSLRGPFSYADLLDNGVGTSIAGDIRLASDRVEREIVTAKLSPGGYLTSLTRSVDGARIAATRATGRLFAQGNDIHLLPWRSRRQAGVLLIDRRRSAFCGALIEDQAGDIRTTMLSGRLLK